MNSLFVAWRPEEANSGWRPVGRLTYNGELYRFCYTRGAKKADFRCFAGMEGLDVVYESEKLFPLFANRLLSASRPEYEDYLRWSGFDPANPPEPIVVLGVTEGIRKTDAVEVFPCPTPDGEGCYLNRFFLHGIRWAGAAALKRIDALVSGESLLLEFEDQNPADPNAVAVYTGAPPCKIGYVPRYLAREVRALATQCGLEVVQLFVERVNRRAPTQNRLLCRMQSCWPDGFQPCDGEAFLPIPAGAAATCG